MYVCVVCMCECVCMHMCTCVCIEESVGKVKDMVHLQFPVNSTSLKQSPSGAPEEEGYLLPT